SLQSVLKFLDVLAPDIEIIDLNQSKATVELAAKANNVEPGQIAKTLSLKVKDTIINVVAKAEARLENKKLKTTFGAK
ncbi:YbaK/EbsC family protein, partial [Salmonella enterica]|uniref:YbaK/EbsC family protein n=1 Tax=Salmonella enterica TaxID=28901 RepID=UPI0026667F57